MEKLYSIQRIDGGYLVVGTTTIDGQNYRKILTTWAAVLTDQYEFMATSETAVGTSTITQTGPDGKTRTSTDGGTTWTAWATP